MRTGIRFLGFALAGFSILAGGLHLHEHGAALTAGHDHGTTIRSVDSHPDAPAHAESFRSEAGAECVACLARHGFEGVVDLASRSASVVVLGSALSSEWPVPRRLKPYAVPGPRAPPSA